MSCAPYLALKVLQQLNTDDGPRFPLASNVLRTGLYVDDCLCGAHNLETASELKRELIELLQAGGFVLRKWASNVPTLIADVDPADHGLAWEKPLHESDGLKVLGIVWNPTCDVFQYKTNLSAPKSLTKRTILSLVAKLYDPLGWVSPVTILAKVFIQQLWLSHVDWDTPLPEDVCLRWSKFYDTLPALDDFAIPRWTGQDSEATRCELHGFSDASSVAYAGAVYLRVTYANRPTHVRLLMSRTKVAPIKQLTIPRLELSGAVLLTRLLSSIRQVPQFANMPIQCWTDSTIVLCWLDDLPVRWKTFVANRVAEVHTVLPGIKWRYVPSADNPADPASRGILASDLIGNPLWLSGPCWLSQSPDTWPQLGPTLPADAPLEARSQVTVLVTHANDVLESLSTTVSTWTRLLRVVAYMLRWKQCLGNRMTQGRLTAEEIQTSEIAIMRELQAVLFTTERQELHSERLVPPKSVLYSLSPFLDEKGLIRVGGRLVNADMPFNTKHPIVLRNHPIVRLLIAHTHQRCLHGGVSLMLRTLRQTVWIVQAKKLIQSVIFRCVVCTRLKADLSTQTMGRLPTPRVVRPERPFAHCGIDYAGPFQVRLASGCGRKSQIAYVALFVCFAIKAVHVELVSEYTSAAFIAAFKRFVSRRGLPTCMYSDQGPNLTCGASDLAQAFQEVINDDSFKDLLAKDQVSWHFIPPAAPHFGGLWEAGVKSVKSHLKRVLRALTPTYEELTTLLCQIESALNSRPLCPMSDDVNDLVALTPGHFLIGGPLNAVPERSLLSEPVNRLSRWQLYRQMNERF